MTEQYTYQEVHFGTEAQKKMLEGAKILSDAVRSTMGPSGQNVIIDNEKAAPLITKDGVTVARSINLKNKLPSVGAELLKEIASKTNELAGDGPQPLYSKVLTPNGWTTMGQLKIGDEICGTNNTVQKVIGIFPKGIKNIIEITTSDNRTVECCEDHLWEITTSYGKKKIVTTKEMLINKPFVKDKNGNIRYKYYLPLTSVEYNKKELPIDPYLLGVLLGDGSLTNKKRNNIEISLGLNDEYVLNKLNLPKDCAISKSYVYNKNYIKTRIIRKVRAIESTIKKDLSELGLLGTKSDTKFIPKNYLYSSVEDRINLLNGLIDTDGHINKRGLFEHGTVSQQLHLDFVELCRSLGIQVYSYKLDRKTDSAYGSKSIYRTYQLKGYKHGIKIKDIKLTNKQTEMQCIKVSNNDNLYITDNHIVTHNTTTATVLGYELLNQGIKMISTGRSAVQMKNGMELAKDVALSFLKQGCMAVEKEEDIINVGTISANGDREIGTLLNSAIKAVGKDGIIAVEATKSVKTTLEVTEGMQINSGYLAPYFITNAEKLTCEYENPYVLMTTQRISSIQDILPILETIQKKQSSLLIICDDMDSEPLQTCIVNKSKGILKICVIKAPSIGEHRVDIMQDICTIIGGEVIGTSSEVSLKNVKLEHLGTCKKVIVSRGNTTIIASKNPDRAKLVEERVNNLRTVLENDKTLDDMRVAKYRERLAKLSGGVAIIKVGGSTEVEILEKKDRVDDALNATMAAIQEGIVPGGGTALFYASRYLDNLIKTNKFKDLTQDELAGVEVIMNTCAEPLKTIIRNTGRSPDVVIDHLITNNIVLFNKTFNEQELFDIKGNKFHWNNPFKQVSFLRNITGYNSYKHEYENLIETGVIDPVKVTRLALEHAVSVVGLMLTCNCVIINEENKDGNK